MGEMATEMARRMAEEGQPGSPAPGTDGERPPEPERPSAGTENAETPSGEGPPDTIPYARFKEVNDELQELRGYKQLSEFGYDPDSLGRLAAFEAQYIKDPVTTINSLISTLDLPQDAKDQVQALLGAGEESGEGGEAKPSGEGEERATLPPEVQERLDWVDQQRVKEAEAANDALLDTIVGHWDSLDKQEGIELPDSEEAKQQYEQVRLMFISQAAREGGFKSERELAEKARAKLLSYNENLIGATVQRGRRSGSSSSVLGGGLPQPEKRSFGGDIKAASRAALEDIKAGRLPGVTGEGG